MKTEKELIYDWLVKNFDEFATQVGGWCSINGTYLDGKLWALAGKLAEAGMWKAFQIALETEGKPTCASCGSEMKPEGQVYRCPNCGDSSAHS